MSLEDFMALDCI